MILLPIILCIVLFSPFSTTSDAKVDIVDVAVKALTEVSIGSPKGLFNSFASQADSFLRALVPIGEIAAGNKKQKIRALKPESEEYKTLMEFRNRMEKVWKDIKNRTDKSTIILRSSIKRYFYEQSVDAPISNMQLLIDRFIDPQYYIDDRIYNNYFDSCGWDETAPRMILLRMEEDLVNRCDRAVTPEEAQEIADIRAYLMSVFLRLRVKGESIPDPGPYVIECFAIYEQMYKHLPNVDLDVYKLSFSSYKKGISAVFRELRSRYSIDDREYYDLYCPLRTLIYGSNFDYSRVEQFASELKNQLIEVTYFAGICADITNGGDAKSIDYWANKTIGYVTRISSHLSKWFNESLTSAWPSAYNGILQENIMRINQKPEQNDVKQHLELVANLTHPILINTGLPNYVYEMVVVRAEEKKYEFHYEGMSNYCSLNKGEFGFDTVIGRIPLNTENQQETFELGRRMFLQRERANNLHDTIQSQMNELYNTATLPLIADTLKQKISKEFISEQDFHCWAIVRKWSSFYKKCPKINYISSSYNFVNLNSVTNISYSNSGHLFQDCEEFRFFFFV